MFSSRACNKAFRVGTSDFRRRIYEGISRINSADCGTLAFEGVTKAGLSVICIILIKQCAVIGSTR